MKNGNACVNGERIGFCFYVNEHSLVFKKTGSRKRVALFASPIILKGFNTIDYLFVRLIIVSFWKYRLFYKAISTIYFRTHLSDKSEVECGFIFQAKTPVLRLT